MSWNRHCFVETYLLNHDSLAMYEAIYISCFYFQVPRESLVFVIPAFGGVVSWDGEAAPYKEADQSITYQVCYFLLNQGCHIHLQH